MSVPKPPKPAKLVIGMLMKDKSLIETVTNILIQEYGQIDIVSPWLLFNYTDYYEPELGSPIYRRLISFENLIDQGSLVNIKLFSNRLENNLSENGKRRVNIDPGYMVLERFVLATGKNYTHRIYIGSGIYADLTLIYQKGQFRPLPWTYPDYADDTMLFFLTKIRNKYQIDLKDKNKLKGFVDQ